MSLTRRAAVTGTFAAAASRRITYAQPEQEPIDGGCPPERDCVDYDGVIIAIDPISGPYQVIIVEEQEVRAETLTGPEVRRYVVGAGFLRGADGHYAFDQLFTKEQVGVFADARLEDVYVLGKSNAAD